MTESAVVYSRAPDAEGAAAELAAKIAAKLPGAPPDALVLFAAPTYDQAKLLRSLHAACRPHALVGSSSAGEFTNDTRGEGLSCALALRSTDMQFAAGIGRGLSQSRADAAAELVSSFKGLSGQDHLSHTALVLTDALAGYADDLVDQLTLATSGKYQFFGGGAGDNAQFRRTSVFFGTEVVNDAVVGLEILSNKPLGIGVGHGWEPASKPMRVTASEGLRLISLNGMPAAQAFEDHAEATGQPLDHAAAIPFFLHNILGIETAGGHRLRVPLAIHDDGSVTCASEIPRGAVVHIMRTTPESAVGAAARATKAALAGLEGQKPGVALFFDCVATRLRMGEVFGLELRALADQLGDASFVGCNTHGQVARAPGQFGGFHNCTAVVCVLPE
ncbi:MAG: FIST N-terminal domain-containing protein [Myxococcota bacterium]